LTTPRSSWSVLDYVVAHGVYSWVPDASRERAI
jgi:hypothetical protein